MSKDEKDKALRMSVYIREDLKDKFKILATIEGESMSSLINGWIEDWIKDRESKLPEHLKPKFNRRRR